MPDSAAFQKWLHPILVAANGRPDVLQAGGSFTRETFIQPFNGAADPGSVPSFAMEDSLWPLAASGVDG